MKLKEIFETAAAGMTSVASIGQIEYAAFPNNIKLYKCDKENKKHCVAMIRRHRNDGWRLSTTKQWKNMSLPHFGHLENIKTPKRGMKTISSDLKNMLKKWGIKYDDLIRSE